MCGSGTVMPRHRRASDYCKKPCGRPNVATWRDRLKPAAIPPSAYEEANAARCLDHPQEEAQTIALFDAGGARKSRENRGLFSNVRSRMLAERVCAVLTRWGIAANDSAGSSLAKSAACGYVLDRCVGSRIGQHATHVDYLSLFEAPFCRLHGLARRPIAARGRGKSR